MRRAHFVILGHSWIFDLQLSVDSATEDCSARASHRMLRLRSSKIFVLVDSAETPDSLVEHNDALVPDDDRPFLTGRAQPVPGAIPLGQRVVQPIVFAVAGSIALGSPLVRRHGRACDRYNRGRPAGADRRHPRHLAHSMLWQTDRLIGRTVMDVQQFGPGGVRWVRPAHRSRDGLRGVARCGVRGSKPSGWRLVGEGAVEAGGDETAGLGEGCTNRSEVIPGRKSYPVGSRTLASYDGHSLDSARMA